MDETEEKDTYVTQLRDVFDSCDVSGDGFLNETGLRELCEKLHLSEHANVLIDHLLEQSLEVNFDDFKECFVAILSQDMSNDGTSKVGNEDPADREVSPKFTLGRKKYGRRSRPASIVDDESSASCDASAQQNVSETCSPVRSSAPLSVGENLPGKRPMSPNDCQQPPTKSGRMREEHEISYASSLPSSDSDHSFESNPVEYLQETWKKLGIGQSGYLNVEELACVCEHIGMDMTEEVVVQLFQKLDCDQDGQISFDEFLQGLFQHGDPQPCESLTMKPNSMYNQTSMDDHQISNTWPAGIFSSIDPNNNGFADASTILELWESLELPCPPRLLEELGFNANSKINLSDLTSTFEDILGNALKRPILKLAFATFQNELHYLRQTIDQMQDERRKLRVNIEEANARAALLAQEVDDNHAKLENSLQKKLLLLEKKYQDQSRELVEELQQERDTIHSQGVRLKQLQQEAVSVQEEEMRMKTRFNLMQQENSRLEHDLRETSEKCSTAEKLNEALQKELSTVPDLKKRLSELESQLLQEQQHQSLILELEKCKKNNQELQDKIDELTLEMESVQRSTLAEMSPPKGVARNHSWLSDYKNTSSGYKRRGSESSSEENSDEDNLSLPGIKRTVNGDKHGDELHASESIETTRKLPFAPTSSRSVDVLLRDMFVDQSIMMKKLQVTEEKYLKSERAHRNAEHKIKMLNQLVRSMARA